MVLIMSRAVIYLHGFNSSPQSMKAVLTKQYFQQHFPEVSFYCPQIISNPQGAVAQITALVGAITSPYQCYFIGSSLGGYLATYFAEKYGCKAVLINPAVKPYELLEEYLGEQTNPYTKEIYHVNEDFIDDLKVLEQNQLQDKDSYFVMVQTGDEVLDYRQAVVKYQNHHLLIQQGGDHSFIDYDKMLPQITAFFFREKKTQIPKVTTS